MVPVSHAPDLKASNPKVSVPQAAGQKAAPKNGFQALIERFTRPVHAEDKPKAAPASARKAKTETPHELPKAAEKLPVKAEKPEKKDAKPAEDAAVLLASLVRGPEPARPEAAKTEIPAAGSKSAKERDAKALAVSAETVPVQQTAVAGVKPAAHAETKGEKPQVVVVDKRTEAKEKEKEKAKVETAANQTQAQTTPRPAPEASAKSDAATGVAETKVVFHPTDQGTPFDLKPQSAAAPVSPRDAAAFQQYLIDKGYGQLVEQARIVLKDNNAGEIRMTLHPESLGKVKVALNLSDGSLAGQIFVENQTVKDVFQSNLDGLLQAFRDGGWNDLNLQVSVGGDNPQRQAGENYQSSGYGRQTSFDDTGAASVETSPRIGAWTDRQVDLTA